MDNLTIPNPIELARAIIRKLSGQTDEEIEAQGPCIGVIIAPEDDSESWADRFYKKDTEGWRRIRDL